MVADGALDFGTGGFGLSELQAAVTGASTIFHTYEVTTAHRGIGTATKQNFVFDANVNRKNFDEIWLFGINTGTGLPSSEKTIVETFMDARGGVFATGDHSELGSALSGNVKRVKSMRYWFSPQAPPMSNENRIDSVSKGPTPDFQFDDQSDEVPQPIFPRYYVTPGGTSSLPHPLLQGPAGDILVLPDHPHEGECVVPNPVDPAEYPPRIGGGARPVPEVVAIGVSKAGYLTDIGKPPVIPRGFGVIGAYDGRPAGVGRVVVQSTWHHFVNINLTGLGTPGRIGLQSAPGVPTADLQDVKAYYRNIARWLDPGGRCRYIRLPLFARYSWPLIEELPAPLPDPPPLDELRRLGQVARKALVDAVGTVEATETATHLLQLLPEQAARALEPFVDPFRPRENGDGSKEDVGLLRTEVFSELLLAGVVSALADSLPGDPHEGLRKLSSWSEKEYEEAVSRGVRVGLRAIGEAAERGSETIGRILEKT